MGLSWGGLGPLLAAFGVSWGASWPSRAVYAAAKNGSNNHRSEKRCGKNRLWTHFALTWRLLASFWGLPGSFSDLPGSIFVSFWPPWAHVLALDVLAPEHSHPRSWQSCYTRFPGTCVGISLLAFGIDLLGIAGNYGLQLMAAIAWDPLGCGGLREAVYN